MVKISTTFRGQNGDSNENLILIDKKLVIELQRLFPDKSADLSMSEKEVWYKSGQANVIRYLKDQYLRQQQLTEFKE